MRPVFPMKMAAVTIADASDTSGEGFDNPPVDVSVAIPAFCLPGHPETNYVLDVSNDGRHVATVSGRGWVFVWSLFTGKMVFRCHKSGAIQRDEVTCGAFSNDAMLLCTGNLRGRVTVWGVWSHQVECEFVTFAYMKWVAWSPQDTLLVGGTVDGIVWRWELPGGECKTMQGSFTTCGDGRILADGRRAAAVYDDGSVGIWDLQRARLLHGMMGPSRVHECPVTSLDVRGELVATGADTVHVFHAGTGRVVATFPRIERAPSTDGDDNYVGTLSLESQQETIAAGTYSGVLAVMDLPSLSEKQRYVHPGAISRAVWGGQHLVFTGCLDGFVRVFDIRAEGRDPVARWKCSTSGVNSLALTPDGLSFVTSSRGGCRIYRFAMLA
ncbi:hypothetical protein HPB48_015971 [Haemaphysalis longicornis]|uniref:Angio-associated migratory cell protein n=1 Tax=Haemaphysalis longicornis TaxID=44386 RepID=A0A9J6G5X8_HAELO|nr:hypothetical protein HPB48_015971 [Haemaphysalis longicornis]